MQEQKLIIITAPSGSGKTTVVNFLLEQFPQLAFGVSACTRARRADEVDGVNYHFMSTEAFQEKIRQDEFVEYEMVYEGKYYGTLKSELALIWSQNRIPVLDIDVHGALRIIKQNRYKVLSLFIKPPSMKILQQRLMARGTESEQSLQERVNKAHSEITYADAFQYSIVNDDLAKTCAQVQQLIATFVA